MLWDKLSYEEQQKKLAIQSTLEEETLLNSQQKYWREYDRAPDEGIPEQKLLDDFVSDLAPAYQEWINKIAENPKCPSWVYPLFALGAHKMADITLRSVMRLWLNSAAFRTDQDYVPSPPLAQHVVRMISKDAINIIAYQNAKENNKEFWRKQSKFIKNWSEKRCIAFATKVGQIPDMTLKQKDDFGHHMLRIAEASGIIQTTKKAKRRGKGWTHALHVEFNPHILMYLNEQHKLMESSMLVYRPMITPPIDHQLNASGGYIHHWIRKDVVHRYVSEYVENKNIKQKHS